MYVFVNYIIARSFFSLYHKSYIVIIITTHVDGSWELRLKANIKRKGKELVHCQLLSYRNLEISSCFSLLLVTLWFNIFAGCL
mmetsp:Transcript_27625/g.81221  ORF Transcript_27625/g.81221 Transcript_27625/m.81221 type:complete len:83 (-) Transcript_27625:83-331(-)